MCLPDETLQRQPRSCASPSGRFSKFQPPVEPGDRLIMIRTINGTQLTQAIELICSTIPEYKKVSKRSQEVLRGTMRESVTTALKAEGYIVIDFEPIVQKCIDDFGGNDWTIREIFGVVWDMPTLIRLSRRADELNFDSVDAELEAILGS